MFISLFFQPQIAFATKEENRDKTPRQILQSNCKTCFQSSFDIQSSTETESELKIFVEKSKQDGSDLGQVFKLQVSVIFYPESLNHKVRTL